MSLIEPICKSLLYLGMSILAYVSVVSNPIIYTFEFIVRSLSKLCTVWIESLSLLRIYSKCVKGIYKAGILLLISFMIKAFQGYLGSQNHN